MNIGDTQKINVTTTPTEGLIEDLEYTSGSPKIATVGTDGTVKGVAEGTAVITIKGKSSGVSTTCTVIVKKTTISITAEQIAANPEKYYGQVAQNYTQGGVTYRIFYVDKENKFGDGTNTIYLKADWTANNTDLLNYTSYIPSGTDLETYKKLNPSWAAQRGSNTSSWNSNECAAAWLCSPSNWKTYCDTSKANYAIGGPSVEMYVASYNQVSHTTGNYTLGATYSTTYKPGYIYTLNGKQSTISNADYWTGNDTLDYTGYNNMYAGQNSSKSGYWWLASPSSNDSIDVCYVNGKNAYLFGGSPYNTYGLGALVSLKSGIQVEIEE